MTTRTFGDFLTAARQRIAAAAQQQGHLLVAAHVEVVCELDRLLSVIARYARDGVHPPGADPTPRVPTMEELTTIGIRPEHQDLRVLGSVALSKERQPAEHPDHEQIDEADERERRA